MADIDEHDLAALKNDAERIDYLEAIIRDGSYVSIINDIAAMCLHCYAHFGNGPALRTAIDAQRLPGLAHEELTMKSVIDRARKLMAAD